MKSIVKSLLLAILVISINACNSNEAQQAEKTDIENPKVVTATVKTISHSDIIRVTGYLAYKNEYKLGFKSGGMVESVAVKEGQFVKAGTLMASLKLDEISAKVSQSEIAVDKAKRDYKRTEALYADSVSTLEQLQNTKSQLQNAEMNLQTAKFNFQQSKIIAPSNGMVQKVLLEANEAVAPGNPVIIFGAENTGKVLITNISDANIVKIKVGDIASLQFDPYPKTIFQGKVIEIAGMATPATGTYEVKMKVEDAEAKLKPGFIGSASIQSSISNKWCELPIEALVSANNDNGIIYTVENGMALQKNIIIERILDDAILVSGEVSEGDKVVIAGQQRLSGKSMKVNE